MSRHADPPTNQAGGWWACWGSCGHRARVVSLFRQDNPNNPSDETTTIDAAATTATTS